MIKHADTFDRAAAIPTGIVAPVRVRFADAVVVPSSMPDGATP